MDSAQQPQIIRNVGAVSASANNACRCTRHFSDDKRARQVVKKVVSSCVFCKKFKAKSGQQPTALQPRDRITESPPFEISGVYFAGPIYVETQSSMTKAVTCAVTRAVHFRFVHRELPASFETITGLCKVIYSDNAKTFKRADQDLKELWVLKIHRYVWRFIAERAACWGGFWEQLVRSVTISAWQS